MATTYVTPDPNTDDPFDETDALNNEILNNIIQKIKAQLLVRKPMEEAAGFYFLLSIILLSTMGIEYDTNYHLSFQQIVNMQNPNLPYIYWRNNMTKNMMYTIIAENLIAFSDDVDQIIINISTEKIKEVTKFIFPVALIEEFTKWFQQYVAHFYPAVEFNINFTTTLIPGILFFFLFVP